MKRYSQPKTGTDDKIVKKDIDYSKINPKTRFGNTLQYYQSLYKGDINNEWQ